MSRGSPAFSVTDTDTVTVADTDGDTSPTAARARPMARRICATMVAMPVHVERVDLPGIGTRHDVLTAGGRRLSVISLRDGGREIAFADEDDPDRCVGAIPLTDDEAAALADVIGGSVIMTQLAGLREQVSGLYTELVPVRADSPYAGRPLGATKARTLTRSSIVAITRDAGVIPSPTPDEVLHVGDSLVAVGTRQGLDALVRLIGGTD